MQLNREVDISVECKIAVKIAQLRLDTIKQLLHIDPVTVAHWLQLDCTYCVIAAMLLLSS